MVISMTGFLRDRDEARDDVGQLRTLVLLEEVTAALDRRVGLALRARDELLEHVVGAAGDGVLVAERAQERLVERLQRLPRLAVRGRGRVVRRGRHEDRELTGALLVGLVRERRVVGG